jgi:hypothetical protein
MSNNISMSNLSNSDKLPFFQQISNSMPSLPSLPSIPSTKYMSTFKTPISDDYVQIPDLPFLTKRK